MKKLITLIPTKGKSKKEIKREVQKQLQQKGFLNKEEEEEEVEIVFVPTK